jgi:hypothetical protein
MIQPGDALSTASNASRTALVESKWARMPGALCVSPALGGGETEDDMKGFVALAPLAALAACASNAGGTASGKQAITPPGMDAFMAVKDRFVTEPYPAWTAVDIDRLYSDNAVAEIKVVARARPAAN